MTSYSTETNASLQTGILNTRSHEQLYYQLYNILFQDISNGVYKVGDLIPSETELVSIHKISRATVRKAMELLVDNGLIERQRGIGSVVVSNRPVTALSHVSSYLKKLKGDPTTPIKQVISSKVAPASLVVSEALNLPENTLVFTLDRVRKSGDITYYSESVFLEASYVPDAEYRDFSTESLRAFYLNVRHIEFTSANQQIFAEAADEHTAQLLDIAVDSPVLAIYRVTYDKDNIPREYLVARYRPEFYYIEMQLNN